MENKFQRQYRVQANVLRNAITQVKKVQQWAIQHNCRVRYAEFEHVMADDAMTALLADIGVCTSWTCIDSDLNINEYAWLDPGNIHDIATILETFYDDEHVILVPFYNGKKTFKANTGSRKTYLDMALRNAIVGI